MGECLAVSASLETDRVPIIERVREASIAIFRGEKVVENLTKEEASMVFSTVYGGLVLSYVCDPVTPISRVHVESRIDLVEGEEGEVDDRKILRAWALIFVGREAEGLDLIKGKISYPVKTGWRPGGGVPISPVGIEMYE